MRRSNRHHPSSAAADAFSQLKTPIRSNINKRTLAAESKSGGRVSWPLKQQAPLPEPRRQRAAAIVAKDAMILMTNNAVVKDLIKSPSPGKKEHPINRAPKRTSNASLSSSSSSAKQTKNADNSMTLVSADSTTDSQESVNVAKQQSPNGEVNPTLLEVSATLPHDLSAFPRELTVKEVIAKSMRANRVSMRGLSRDIVGIMKDIQSKESRASATTSQEGAIPSMEQQASTSRDVDKLNADKSDQKAPLVVALEGLFGASNSDASVLSLSTPPAEENVKDALRQDHMTVQEVINPPLPPAVPSSLSSTEDERVPLPTVRAEHMPKTVAQMGTSNSATERITKKKGENKSRIKSDDEVLVDVVGNGNSKVNDANRELNGSEKILIIADFDAGMLPHELENKYNVSKMQVAEVLRNRIPIIRQQASSLSDRLALKRRRTNFVGLNIMMWRFFCDCRDQGIVLNGRQLKEHALTIARQLGLHNFKGSEGWLDSFKRRHNIDLKTMTGHPVIYETDNDGNVFCPGENIIEAYSPRTDSPQAEEELTTSTSMIVDANQFLIDAANAAARAVSSSRNFSPNNNLNTLAIAACNTGEIGPCQATAAVHTTQPLDLAMLPTTSTGLSTPTLAKKTPSAATCVVRGQPLLSPVGAVSDASLSTVQALVETCCYRVDEPEVAHAMETLRSYITMNDVSLMPALVNLQKGLATIAANRRAKQPTKSKMTTALPVSLTVTLPTATSDIDEQQVSVNVSPATSSNAVLDIRTASLNACNTSSAEMTDSSTAVLKRETIQSQLSLL
uniref:HTH CENPB-type domain-containing protein n=2 Tax=Parascaris univalens TaxID=6257 RepID=A0A915BJA8_PARUN